MVKQNEALYLQNKINCQETMRFIEDKYGPFDNTEIDLVMNTALQDSTGNPIINGFQKQLIFDMFYKYFKDRQSILAINRRQYAKLIIICKRMLLSKNMIMLPYILSGKVEKLVSRKSINKKELMYMDNIPAYKALLEEYSNHDISKDIKSIIATIISSEFSIVDTDPEIHGRKIDVIPQMIIGEVLTFIQMCL